ncbi:hypothetical protein [Anoxynatronum buryatiense]|uniref:Uncharacterized protein n=1 Tax=Anoxynatronum buryatiense TaxID=489973 RepID=A0AA45WXG6_9CLOT|nr:hypothetical protein [Anoxynatronum buryatiense]SMP64288.1 hypothetical protein SAMN06296020_111127 [Anoxynatronum buryatiense]
MAINYKKCPRCGKRDSIPIVYGYPTVELAEEAEKGKVVLGGCCVMEDDPEFHCQNCNYQWNRLEAEEAAYGEITGFKASVGGYFDGFTQVHIDFAARQIIRTHSLDDPEAVFSKRLAVKTLKNLPGQLKDMDLLNWKRRYENSQVLDGTQWQVEIQRQGRILRKSGSNGFPDKWDDFCRLIQKISGRPFA